MSVSSGRESTIDDARWVRWAIACGPLFLVLVIASMISAPQLAGGKASGVAFAASYSTHQMGHVTSTYLSGLAVIAFIIFLSGLYVILRRWDRDGGLSLLCIGSGLAAILLVLVAQAVYAGTALASTMSAITPGALRGTDTLVFALMQFSSFPRVVFLAIAATIVLRSGIAARWVGWIGLVVAVINLVGTTDVFDMNGILGTIGFLAVVTFVLWTTMLSLAILIRAPAYKPAAMPATA